MTEPTNGLGLLEERVARLQKENRWIKIVGVAVVVVIFSFLTLGRPQQRTDLAKPTTFSIPPKTIEVESIVLKDRSGKIRAILGKAWEGQDAPAAVVATNLGSYGLHIYSENGRYIVGLAERTWSGGSGGTISLYDNKTASSAHMLSGSGISSIELEATDTVREVREREWNDYANKWNSAQTSQEKTKLDEMTPEEGYKAKLTAWTRGERSYLELGRHLTKSRDSGAVQLDSSKGQPSITLSDEDGRKRAVFGST